MKNIRSQIAKEGLDRLQYRLLSTRDAKVDAESRTITFPFSSELPVERWWGNEILSHKKGAADLSFLASGHAPLLFNHKMDDYRGVVMKAWIDNSRGETTVRFGKSPQAEQLVKDIDDGIISNVSFMYEINEVVLSKTSDTGPDEYTVTKWKPLEVSFVTIPADASVGLGREYDAMIQKLTKNAGAESAHNGGTMKIRVHHLMDRAGEPTGGGSAPIEPKTVTIVDDKAVERALQAESVRVESILSLGEKYSKPELARKLIKDKTDLSEARAQFLEAIGQKQRPVAETDADVGLTDKEARQFSFLNVIRALANPGDHRAQESAKFEREVSDAAIQKSKRTDTKGFLVPFDVLRMPVMDPEMVKALKRDLVVGTGSAGGNLVATQLAMGSFIELLRNKSAMQAAGATILSGLMGNIAIPRQTSASTAYWIGESGAATESQQAFDQVTMTPKTISAFSDFSRRLTLQSSMDVEMFVRNDLARTLALGLDYAALYGTGSSNQPLGLKGQTGLNTKDFAADAPTWAEVVNLETQVNAANADIGSMKYLLNATGRGVLKTTEKASSTAQFIMQEDGSVNGYPSIMSNQVASNDFWFGVWSQLIMGFWSGIDIMVDPYGQAKEAITRVVAHQDCDIAVRQPTAFTRGNNTL